MIYFQDKEIIIRDISLTDGIYLFTWDIDKEINAHDPRPLPDNTEELLLECTNFCTRFNNDIMNENVSSRKYIYFIITDLNDQPIGYVNFFSFNNQKKQCEMGIILGDKRYWKRGIAIKAVPIIMKQLIKEKEINRVYIETGSTNHNAIKLFEKLNFKVCDEYIEEDNDFKFIVMEYLHNS